MTRLVVVPDPPRPALPDALAAVAAGAAERDRDRPPAFPYEAFDALERGGFLAGGARAGAERPPAREELELVRAVSRADAGVGRILDGHLNAVERLAVAGPSALRDSELDLVRTGCLRAGVWGADPRPSEGAPATIVSCGGRSVLRGVKTFCSGAGGLNRALVLAALTDDDTGAVRPGPPAAAWVDLGGDVMTVDPTWFGGAGLRSSVSHRVTFHDAPVLAVLGDPGWITAQPWFGRDALRTSATWAGLVDAAADAAVAELRTRSSTTDLEALAAGRIRTEQATVDVWQRRAAEAMDVGDPRELREVSVHARAAIAAAATRLLDEAGRACGSHPFATGGPLERARRDLDVFLLQHRLDPLLARDGRAALRGLEP